MAHVGRSYKLQFRRDLHLNVNNDQGFPEAFNARMTGFSGAKGSLLAAALFQPVNLAKSNQPPMIWTSSVVVSSGFHWRLSIESVAVPWRSGTAQQWLIELEEIGVGVAIVGVFNDPIASYSAISATPDGTLVHYAPGYAGGPPLSRCLAAAASWATYNP
jgi:hypothetical protein